MLLQIIQLIIWLLLCRLTSLELPNVVEFSEAIGNHLLLPCGPSDPAANRHYIWYANERDLEEIPAYRTILPNGTLSVYVRMADSDIVYTCNTSVLSANDLLESQDTYRYKIYPKVKAFLKPTVQNTTLDWGTYYTFPCVFSGTLPRKEYMILNNKVVTERRHNITSNSVVECIVENELGKVHDKAYITVRPGSQAWNAKYDQPSDLYCLDYSVALNESSVCRPYLSQVATAQPKPYLVARYRLYDSSATDKNLAILFDAWDSLLLEQQQKQHHQSFNGSSPISYTAWRCVDWAKRLTCAYAYPSCENLAASASTNEAYLEHGVCPLHCLAVAGLFCLPALNVTLDSSTLDLLINGQVTISALPPTGWDQLMSSRETHLPNLPELLALHHEIQSDLNPARTCGLLDEDGRIQLFESEASCIKLPLDTIYEDPLARADLPDDFEYRPPHPQAECISGNGRQYRGSVSDPDCSPWASVLGHFAQSYHSDPNLWPGLLALSQRTFSNSIDHEASTAPVCRNPAGLAPAPFCLTRGVTGNENQSHPVENRIHLCKSIPPCPDLLDHNSTFPFAPMSDPDSPLDLGSVKVQIVVVCTVVTCLICFIITLYFLWRANRCGLRGPSDSDLHLSVLDCHQLVDEKGQPLRLDEKLASDGIGKTLCRLDYDVGSEQAYLKHRLRWLKRRRRLRQLRPAFQCFVGSFYVLSDCVMCQPRPGSHETAITDWSFSNGRNSTANRDGVQNQFVKSNPSRRKWCPISFKRKPPVRKHHDDVGPNKQCSRIRRLTSAFTNEHDDEFEANTLGMQLHKSVAYVANLTASHAQRNLDSQEATSPLTSVCINCGVYGTATSCDLCSACLRKHRYESTKASSNADYDLAAEAVVDEDERARKESLMLNGAGEDPGAALTESSMQMINSGSSSLGCPIAVDMLFNWASMTHLLHPKLKQVCYPRSKLIEIKPLAERAFGWIVLVHVPNLNALVRRHRLLSTTTISDRLSMVLDNENSDSGGNKDFSFEEESFSQLAVVKMLTNDAGLKTEANFLREAEVLVELSHKNIIVLHGICLPLKPLSLILEYMPFGDLATFLRHYQRSSGGCRPSALHMSHTFCSTNGMTWSRENSTLAAGNFQISSQNWIPPANLSVTDLLEMARDACDALVYLSENYYVHRDVATRSFLVGNRMQIKLADFSMCRPVQPGVDVVVAQDVFLPIKWLPLESILDGRFNVDTDVWSFGVFMWELFTYASEPYPDLNLAEVVAYLETGGRLDCPASCSPDVYDLMRSCWAKERCRRPSFHQIRSRLQHMLSPHSANR